MALSGNNNLLLGASHFHNTRPQRHRQNIVIEAPDTHSFHHLASSAQSLQAMLSLTPPSTSTSYPYLEQLVVKTPPTSIIPSSLCKDPTTNNSLYRLKNSCLPTHVSISKIISRDDLMNKSSDERTGSTNLSVKNLNEKPVPIEISVRCIFLRVGEIDTLNERYTGEIFFEASWYVTDPNIESEYDPQTGNFNPQLAVLNHMGDSLRHDKWYSTNKTDKNGLIEITEHHKFKGTFWERMELNHFPYDVQELSISLTTPLTINDICFTENKQKPSGVNRTVFSDQQSWHLYEHVEFSFEQHREEYSLNYDQIHPVLICTCHVGRKCGYYIWNAYFLIFLITSASLCTFSIPPSNAHGRLQITCTLLLTSVTFRWVVNKSLPTISYLTALDIYAIASIVALCIINVFHGVVSYLYYNQIYLASHLTPNNIQDLQLSLYPEYYICHIDRYGFYILSIIFCLYQVFILLWTFWTPYKRRRSMKRKDEKNRADLMNKIGNGESLNEQ
ncbi:unnamed protein product [Rotaria sp. Silwood1]|nr:unnamed protein product [Rotaria sp. Silwood1]CAF0996882.1 unnamed protein product [Rotaria sp. Silwood1]CAF3419777.1 unnamed protein product [Rotaria sp. Silwood1]CAF3421285.1 unnamed protein product [Rotaria sp. Silwood1]CAF4487890.1 unnamed protein product [Rotaria sp. Silwood1]